LETLRADHRQLNQVLQNMPTPHLPAAARQLVQNLIQQLNTVTRNARADKVRADQGRAQGIGMAQQAQGDLNAARSDAIYHQKLRDLNLIAGRTKRTQTVP
jgi:hypothetical protein